MPEASFQGQDPNYSLMSLDKVIKEENPNLRGSSSSDEKSLANAIFKELFNTDLIPINTNKEIK
jgi:hypothetical protein